MKTCRRTPFTLDPGYHPTLWPYIQNCRCGMEVYLARFFAATIPALPTAYAPSSVLQSPL